MKNFNGFYSYYLIVFIYNIILFADEHLWLFPSWITVNSFLMRIIGNILMSFIISFRYVPICGITSLWCFYFYFEVGRKRDGEERREGKHSQPNVKPDKFKRHHLLSVTRQPGKPENGWWDALVRKLNSQLLQVSYQNLGRKKSRHVGTRL